MMSSPPETLRAALCCQEIPYFIPSFFAQWVLLCCEVLSCLTWLLFVFGLLGQASSRGELLSFARRSTLPFQPRRVHLGRQTAVGCCSSCTVLLSVLALLPGISEVPMPAVPWVRCPLTMDRASSQKKKGVVLPGYLNVPPPP